jgi:hypothetical protein
LEIPVKKGSKHVFHRYGLVCKPFWRDACARCDDAAAHHVFRGGIYRSQETILTRSGAEAKPITFRNYANEVPIFDGTDTHWNAQARFPNAFYSEYPNVIRHITFEGLVIRNYFRGGIHLGSNYIANSPAQSNDHITIRHCLIDHCGQNGINIANGDWTTIENCLIGRTGWRKDAGSWSSNINLINMIGRHIRVAGNVSFHADSGRLTATFVEGKAAASGGPR